MMILEDICSILQMRSLRSNKVQQRSTKGCDTLGRSPGFQILVHAHGHSQVAMPSRHSLRGSPSCLQKPYMPTITQPESARISHVGLAASGISQAHSSPNWTLSSLFSAQIFLIISPPTQSTYFLFMGVNIEPAGLIFHREPFQWHPEPSKFKEQESWFSAHFIIKGFTINIRIWIPPK